jgi:hypothetical protein
MTDQRAVPNADLDIRPVGPDAPLDGRDDLTWDDEWDDEWAGDWDDDWDRRAPAASAPQPVAQPWYRSPRLLVVLIGAAAAMLVVATALLVGGRFGGQIPTSPQLDIRTALPSASATPPPSRVERRNSTTPSTTGSPTPSSAADAPTVVPEPVQPLPAPSLEAPPAERAPADSDGPSLNVTRTPMSFSPGGSARR